MRIHPGDDAGSATADKPGTRAISSMADLVALGWIESGASPSLKPLVGAAPTSSINRHATAVVEAVATGPAYQPADLERHRIQTGHRDRQGKPEVPPRAVVARVSFHGVEARNTGDPGA